MFNEPIDIFFELEAKTITSDDWILATILGFAIEKFYGNDEFIQKTEKQEFTFYVKTAETKNVDFALNTEFVYESEHHRLTFKTATLIIDDNIGDGLGKFRANFISKELL